MAQLKNEEAYNAAMQRIEELLKVVTDETPVSDPNYQELDILSDMVAEYENIHYTFAKPKLTDVIRLRMYERSLTQAAVARLLGISPSRMSELMHGKMEPSYQLSRDLCLKLNIGRNLRPKINVNFNIIENILNTSVFLSASCKISKFI